MYSQSDFQKNKANMRKSMTISALAAIPFAAMAIAGFVMRMELLCAAGCMLALSVLIFLWDLRVSPQWRYGRFLKEIHSGLSRKSVGTLVRIGSDAVFKDGVNFYDVIINIYEDQSEDGERRFLLDCAKHIPSEWVGQDIVLTSHGNMVLAAEPAQKSVPAV